METQKIINLLNDSSNECVIDNSIKFETESIKSSLCDYSDTFILVIVDITVNAGNDVDVAFKNCHFT